MTTTHPHPNPHSINPQIICNGGSQLSPQPSGSRPTSAMAKLKTMFGPKKSSAGPFGERSPAPSRTPSPLQSPVNGPSRAPSVNGKQKSTITISPVPSTHSQPQNSIMSLPSANNSTSTLVTPKRIIILENGNHEHYLKSNRRQEKLGKMLRDIIGTGQKIHNDAVSAMPDLVDKDKDKSNHIGDLTLMSGLVSQIEKGEKDVRNIVRDTTLHVPPTNGSSAHPPPKSLLQKYGKCQEIIGKGAYGVVRVSHKYDHISRREVLFAVKEFKKRQTESENDFSKRLTSEFCISSSLHHANIIQTLDLMKDARGVCCQVMEYCEGGDLYSLILASEGGLDVVEADCFFKQIMRGVVYMHSMGVAHCDLKPENILLTPTGVIKISDFGNGECFRMAWESEVHLLSGVCGSKPYIAPEEFEDEAFDPRAVDVWATGVIYMAMRTGSYLWQIANEDDEYYSKYLQGRKHQNGYEPIEMLKRSKCKNVIYSILDPKPNRRISGKQVLNSEWGRSIQVCECGEQGH